MDVAVNTDDRRISEEAVAFAKANRKEIAKRLTDPLVYLSEDSPVSVFMAGSPGAGKTEASLEFLTRFGGCVLRIDTVSLNIRRSLKRGRFVLVLYVYQNPERAWEFVQAREKVEGRNIPMHGFVDQYFAARKW